MRPARPLLRALLVPVCLLLGVSGAAGAQEHGDHAAAAADTGAHAMRTMRWSDPAAWPDGKVPGEGDAVTIARDMEVVLDVDPPALRSLTIEGKLSFSNDRDIGARNRVDLRARGRAADRQRGQSAYAQGDHHADRHGPRRRHQHHGRPRHHADGRHAQPARRPRAHLDQAGRDRRARQQPDRSARRLRLARGRRDRPRLDRLRSAAGRAAHHRRHQRQHAHARPRRSNTCTSARSPSASTSAAKSAC